MKTNQINGPTISRNKKDPTQSYRSLNKTYRVIENRYNNINSEIKKILETSLIWHEKKQEKAFIFREGVIYQTNSDCIYDMSPEQLNALFQQIEQILEGYLLTGGEDNHWQFTTIEDEYRRGTHLAFSSLSKQSTYYAEQTSLINLLSRPAYQNRIAQALTLTFSDWKILTETVKADLLKVIVNAVARGINPNKTARIISKRLDISLSKAKSLAQTEQLSAYREAIWNESEWVKDRLGLRVGLLHQSALLPTSRVSHVYWSGRIRTADEVREWYSEDGNRFNCHCTQIPILLDENGLPYNEKAIDLLIKSKESWFVEREE